MGSAVFTGLVGRVASVSVGGDRMGGDGCAGRSEGQGRERAEAAEVHGEAWGYDAEGADVGVGGEAVS